MFLKLLGKYFPKTNKLHKISSRNLVRVSYGCTENVFQIISSCNKNVLQPNKNQELSCDCRQKENSLMQRKCRMKKNPCKCTASTPTKPQRVFIGKSEDK